jgi:Mg-chelatase subunit ChlI
MAMRKATRRDEDDPVINFSGVEKGFGAIPDGEYRAVITSAEKTKSSNGNWMAAIKWKISEGKFKGRQLFDNVSLLPQAFWRFQNLLEAVGIEPQEEDVRASEYIKELPDGEAMIVVTNSTWEGQERPKVTGYSALDGEEEEEEPRLHKKAKAKAEEEDEDEEAEDEDEEEAEEEDEEEEKPKKKGLAKKARIKEGSRVKFDDGDGNIIKGTVTSLDGDEAEVEDKNGDTYEGVPLSQMELA